MDNLIAAPRRSAWIRGAFAASLVAAGALALSPDWASVLKAQGYYGSVDLGVTLVPSQTPRAGETVDFLVTVRNNGPEAANRVRTIAGAQNLHVLETSGCAADPLGYPQCALASPLAAGASGDYLLRMKVPPSARGNMVLSVGATSDDDEIAPGDEVALFKAPIVVAADLQTSLSCEGELFPRPDGHLVCQVEIRNDGPGTTFSPTISLTVWSSVGAYWSCTANRPGICTVGSLFATNYAFRPPSLNPGDVVQVRTEMIAPSLGGYMVSSLHGSVWVGTDELDLNYTNNSFERTFDTTLFRDDFEPTSPSPNP